MTPKQIQQFNKMRNALIQIGKHYQTPAKLKKDSEKDWGLDYEEALEMSYENIQSAAKYAVKGIKAITPKPTTP